MLLVHNGILDKLVSRSSYPSRKDNNGSSLKKQFKPENGQKIHNTITAVTCINCNVRVPIAKWNKHKKEVHMKGISSLRNILNGIDSVDDGLDLRTCIKYIFKKL